VIGYKSGEVLELKVLSAYYHACSVWDPTTGRVEYEEGLENHGPYCLPNFDGSAWNMEVQGMASIFKRSVETLFEVFSFM